MRIYLNKGAVKSDELHITQTDWIMQLGSS